MPSLFTKKDTQKSRNKSVLTENGLVSKFSSRPQSAVGTTLHLHESKTFENSYGIHQLSRARKRQADGDLLDMYRLTIPEMKFHQGAEFQ
ncbi:hypothetical protein QYF36_020711 [Acer negundo]|nr:hypothetical protein QYF36_020711 [Acer negundo]